MLPQIWMANFAISPTPPKNAPIGGAQAKNKSCQKGKAQDKASSDHQIDGPSFSQASRFWAPITIMAIETPKITSPPGKTITGLKRTRCNAVCESLKHLNFYAKMA